MKKNHGFDMVVGLFMICVFAACVFFALAAGVRVYKDVSAVMEEQYGARTAVGYLSTKLRQSDSEDWIEVGDFHGLPAIIVRQTIDGVDYTSFIYCHEGYITELFCPATESMGPEAGLPVIPAESLDFELSGKLLRIDCRVNGGDERIFVALRCETGGGA